MMRIFITGGGGFIGSNLAAFHVNKGDEVIVLDNFATGRKTNIAPLLKQDNFSFYQVDMLTWNGLENILKEVDRVYHLAAVVGMFEVLSDPIKTLNVNVNATLRLLEAIEKMPKKPLVLLASSSEVYGNRHGSMLEEMPLVIENSLKSQAAYAISKLYDESLAASHFKHAHLPCIILRIFNTIGINQSDQYGMVVPRFIRQALCNEDITIYGSGKQRRSFCDVRDLVAILDEVAQVPELIGQAVNIGHDEDISIYDLAVLVKQLIHSQSNLKFIPFEEVYSDKFIFIEERVPNLTKLREYIHYKYKWTIDSTLKDLIAHEQKIKK